MNVIIELNTRQVNFDNNEIDNIKLTSSAKLKSSENFDLVSYEENTTKDLKGNKTVLKIEENSITMIRYGKNVSNIYFKEGINSRSFYNTDYGNIELDILTKKLYIEKGSSEILYKIKIEYEINIKNLFKGLNVLDISIKKEINNA